MKKNKTAIAVTSRSFSKNTVLREELLSRFDNVVFNDQGKNLSGAELVDFLRDREGAIVALETVDETILAQLPKLKVISKYGVGLDMLDLDAMKKFGIRLGWTGGVNKRAVAELTLAFALLMLRKIPESNRRVLGGEWTQVVGRQLSCRTVGIVGCGHVGKDLVKLLKPFQCKILVHDILDFPDFYRENGVVPVALDQLLCTSDIVSLHLPLNESTRGILNHEKLSLLNRNSILINTARGGLIDESALRDLLVLGKIRGAAFDVFSGEPEIDIELVKLPNFFCTSHIGGSSEEAILAMGRAAIAGLD